MNNNESSYMVRAMAHGGLIRALAVNATSVVADLRERHGTSPSATAALGRVAIGALLFGGVLKEEDQLVTVRIHGNGPGGVLLASANGKGEVRALIQNPSPDIDESLDGRPNVPGIIGNTGKLTVTRDIGMKQPYAGTVEITSGEVGEDLAYYLATSEQIPSAIGFGEIIAPDGTIEVAGGYMVQIFAGVPEAVVAEIEWTIATLPHPSTMLQNGNTPELILARILGDDCQIIDRTEVRFACPCSWERAAGALTLLGVDELNSMIADSSDGRTELKCEFCGKAYHFTNADLSEMAARRP